MGTLKGKMNLNRGHFHLLSRVKWARFLEPGTAKQNSGAFIYWKRNSEDHVTKACNSMWYTNISWVLLCWVLCLDTITRDAKINKLWRKIYPHFLGLYDTIAEQVITHDNYFV